MAKRLRDDFPSLQAVPMLPLRWPTSAQARLTATQVQQEAAAALTGLYRSVLKAVRTVVAFHDVVRSHKQLTC